MATIDVIGVCLPGVNPNVRHFKIYPARENFVCIYKFFCDNVGLGGQFPELLERESGGGEQTFREQAAGQNVNLRDQGLGRFYAFRSIFAINKIVGGEFVKEMLSSKIVQCNGPRCARWSNVDGWRKERGRV